MSSRSPKMRTFPVDIRHLFLTASSILFLVPVILLSIVGGEDSTGTPLLEVRAPGIIQTGLKRIIEAALPPGMEKNGAFEIKILKGDGVASFQPISEYVPGRYDTAFSIHGLKTGEIQYRISYFLDGSVSAEAELKA